MDEASGIVGRVVSGHGTDTTVVSSDPRSGFPLQGFRLPDWDVAMQMCLRAARLFPGFHVQSWDIALTTRGPVILEVNPVGGAVGHQLAYQKGFLQPDMEVFLRRLGAI